MFQNINFEVCPLIEIHKRNKKKLMFQVNVILILYIYTFKKSIVTSIQINIQDPNHNLDPRLSLFSLAFLPEYRIINFLLVTLRHIHRSINSP